MNVEVVIGQGGIHMHEESGFDYLETKLMEWDDETSRRWAFEEFVSGLPDERNGLGFVPRSMDDYRRADVAERRRAMDFCLRVARSERFSEERMALLRKSKELLKELGSGDYPMPEVDNAREAIIKEIRLHVGYLNLVCQLLQMDDADVSDS